jgi:hypothetical protein
MQQLSPQELKTIIVARAIHQEEDFKAGPLRIYEALLAAKQFTALSGGRMAEIDRTVGAPFLFRRPHQGDLIVVTLWEVTWTEAYFSTLALTGASRRTSQRSAMRFPAQR